jgi:hypothetical protein
MNTVKELAPGGQNVNRRAGDQEKTEFLLISCPPV